MKKLILILCIALVGYGCEKASEKIEPKLKVLKLLDDDYGSAYRLRLWDAQELVMEMQFQKIESGDYSSLSDEIDKTVDLIHSMTNQINNLRSHKRYWENAFESGCIESANFAYDRYMLSLYNHLYEGDTFNFRKRVELRLRYLKGGVEPNPSIRAIAKSNLDLVLEYEEKLEENYNANLQAN